MADLINNLLQNAKTIAIIGCSGKAYRTSYQIAEYLQTNGYRIVPVNPEYDQILGRKVYASLTDIPKEVEVDIVDIFRDSRYTADMVSQVIEYKKNTGLSPAVWTQLEVSSEEAKKKADDAGFVYIENRCIMVEHRRIAV